jgi:hypothetical protein
MENDLTQISSFVCPFDDVELHYSFSMYLAFCFMTYEYEFYFLLH